MTPPLVRAGAQMSTCQKRVVVCVIVDSFGRLLACASNHCAPPNGQCTRMASTQSAADYPRDSTCNWQHAEARAVAALAPGAQPYKAVLYGHDFVCGHCENTLRAAGVQVIDVVPAGDGIGLREVSA